VLRGNSTSRNPAISADGSVVAFDSRANNLVDGDTNSRADIFHHNLSTSKRSASAMATAAR